MTNEEQAKKMQQIFAKAWNDDTYKQKLLSEPMATLLAEGIELPEGVELKIVENTSQVNYLVLPQKPAIHELSSDELDKVAGGSSCATP